MTWALRISLTAEAPPALACLHLWRGTPVRTAKPGRAGAPAGRGVRRVFVQILPQIPRGDFRASAVISVLTRHSCRSAEVEHAPV